MSEIKTPIKAIRAKCLDCSGNSASEVRTCVMPGCPLYSYRMGKNPNRQGRPLSDTQRELAETTLAKYRSSCPLRR